MNTQKIALVAAALVTLAACSKKDEQTTADTTLVKGADTVKVKTDSVKPTTDTLVTKTTTTVDTLKGKAADSTKAKPATKTKPGTKKKP